MCCSSTAHPAEGTLILHVSRVKHAKVASESVEYKDVLQLQRLRVSYMGDNILEFSPAESDCCISNFQSDMLASPGHLPVKQRDQRPAAAKCSSMNSPLVLYSLTFQRHSRSFEHNQKKQRTHRSDQLVHETTDDCFIQNDSKASEGS